MRRCENPAVVIGGTENGLGVIRNLGRNGVDVYCVVSEKDEAVYSKYCREYFVIPGVTHDLFRLKAFLTSFGRQIACKAVLFPTSDISALNVSRLMNEISDYYVAPLSDCDVLETLIVKRKFYLSLMEKGVPHPITLFPDVDDLEDVGAKMAFPVFVKPSMSQIFGEKFRKKGFVANSEPELRRYLTLARKNEIEVVVQQLVIGPASNNYALDGYFDRTGKLAAFFARRVLRIWPISFGNSSACVGLPVSEVLDMKKIIVRYLSSIGYRGIFNAHFKVDARDNSRKLLEVNARSVGGGGVANTFPSACGVNLILMAYLDALGKEIETIRDYETGTCVLNSMNELKWISAMFAQREFSLEEWLSTIRGKKHWTIWARDDVKPFIASYCNMAAEMIKQRNTILKRLKESNV